jgi:crotonobetainyl-CoA:carnitine CoA-transferase CaiB-like acyl-CoA transferase
MRRALEGVRVLDLTRVLSGPFCTAILADMGAEVIKVEHPEGGDLSREPSVAVNGESYYFMSLNRGKKGITLNLKTPEGVRILKELAAGSDVLIENFRPSVMEKLGLSYADIRQVKPDIIYLSISGFGQNSPLANLPAFDIVAQAMGGLMSITGQAGSPPTRVGASLGDTSTALYAAFAVVTALYHRRIHGVGQFIDVAMVDSIFSLLEMSLFKYLGRGEVPGRIGSRHPTSYPYDVFRAADGYFVIATFDNPGFTRLCEAMGQPDLASREEFATDTLRGRHAEALKAVIEAWASAMTVDQVIAILERKRVPVSPIYNIDQIAESEHIKAREMLVEIEHPVAGKVRLPALPVKFAATPAVIASPPPALGQHSAEVLETILKYSPERIAALRKAGII